MTGRSFKNPCMGRILTVTDPSHDLDLSDLCRHIESWVKFQDNYECIFLIQDVQLRNGPEEGLEASQIKYEFLADVLAAGISPNRSIIALESGIVEYQEAIQEILRKWTGIEPGNVGLSADLQSEENWRLAATFLSLNADTFPLMGDQSHQVLELIESWIDKFNHKFGQFFSRPKAIDLETQQFLLNRNLNPRSRRSLILLRESDEETEAKIWLLPTNALQSYLERFEQSPVRAAEMIEKFNLNKMSEKTLREHLVKTVNEYLHSLRVKRDKWIANPQELTEILSIGARRAQAIAHETLSGVQTRLYS